LVIDIPGATGIPSEDTFRRVFEQLTKQFEQCFERWVKQLVTEFGIGVIAVDGKVSGRMTANQAPKLCISSVPGR